MAIKENDSFEKYKIYGAYHWAAFSRDPRKHDLFTYTRYTAMLDNIPLGDGMNILDLGCGDGALTYLTWKKNPLNKVVGVEPESVGRSLAEDMFKKKNAHAQFVESTKIIMDESQDIVLCADVIEHVEKCEEFLNEICRILKPNALAIISTPVRLIEFPQDKEHVHEYFPEEFSKLINNYLYVAKHDFCSSVFALELYTWKPKLFRGRPILGWIMSFLNITFKINLLRSFNPGGYQKLWSTQIITAVKKKQ